MQNFLSNLFFKQSENSITGYWLQPTIIFKKLLTIHLVISSQFYIPQHCTSNYFKSNLRAARSLADRALGLTDTSYSVGTVAFRLIGSHRFSSNDFSSSTPCTTNGLRDRSVMLMFSFASMSMPWKCRFTMRSSRE